MKPYYKDNGITTASSRKRLEEKYKPVHYMSENKSTEKLISTDNVRTKLLTASKILKDELFDKSNDNNILSVKYHCSCYKTYILRSERQSKNKLAEISSAKNNSLENETKDDTEPRANRTKSQDNAPKFVQYVSNNICIKTTNCFLSVKLIVQIYLFLQPNLT